MGSEGLDYGHSRIISCDVALQEPEFFPRRVLIVTVPLTYKILTELSGFWCQLVNR